MQKRKTESPDHYHHTANNKITIKSEICHSLIIRQILGWEHGIIGHMRQNLYWMRTQKQYSVLCMLCFHFLIHFPSENKNTSFTQNSTKTPPRLTVKNGWACFWLCHHNYYIATQLQMSTLFSASNYRLHSLPKFHIMHPKNTTKETVHIGKYITSQGTIHQTNNQLFCTHSTDKQQQLTHLSCLPARLCMPRSCKLIQIKVKAAITIYYLLIGLSVCKYIWYSEGM